MGRPTDEERLLSLVPEDGTTIGNKRLCEQLRWEDEKYAEVRDRLVEKGALIRGPGYGGTVRRAGAREVKPTRYEAHLEWIGPTNYDDLVNNELSAEREAFWTHRNGIYLWQVQTCWGLLCRHLYVGQTGRSFVARTRQHLKGNLGQKLRALKKNGQEPYILLAHVKYLEIDEPQIMVSIERALIWNLNPKWNTQHNVTAEIPLRLRIENIGVVPRGVPSLIKVKAGQHHRGI